MDSLGGETLDIALGGGCTFSWLFYTLGGETHGGALGGGCKFSWLMDNYKYSGGN